MEYSLDLEKVSRRIAIAFIGFMIGSYSITFAPGFNETIVKGALLSAFIFPPLYMHYGDETKYQFSINKGA